MRFNALFLSVFVLGGIIITFGSKVVKKGYWVMSGDVSEKIIILNNYVFLFLEVNWEGHIFLSFTIKIQQNYYKKELHIVNEKDI